MTCYVWHIGDFFDLFRDIQDDLWNMGMMLMACDFLYSDCSFFLKYQNHFYGLTHDFVSAVLYKFVFARMSSPSCT
jgi:hypothetical protein